MAASLSEAVRFQGLPCVRMCLPNGDSALVSLHGAHVLSWVSSGRERLYLSPRSVFDGQAAIRGGIPVCFPQFNQRGPHAGLPKHGFARNLAWESVPVVHPQPGDEAAASATGSAGLSDSTGTEQSFRLTSGPATQRWWPQTFEATLTVALSPGSLQVTLAVRNTDDQPLAFTGALHTYLVADAMQTARLHGLGGQAEWDALTDIHAQAADPLRFEGEFDRVYAAAPQSLTLRDAAGDLHITQSPGWGQTVVWNPGPHNAKALADMPDDAHQHMLCVEAAQVFAPITVEPGGTWQGWQRLSLNQP